MKDTALWRIDATKEEAKAIFDAVVDSFPSECIFMSLRTDSHVPPVFLKNYDLSQIDWGKEEHGWLFCSEGELKWRRLGNALRFVYLGEKKEIVKPVEDCSHCLAGLDSEEGKLIAWKIFPEGNPFPLLPFGSPSGGQKLPQSVRKLAFQIRKYLNSDTGEVQFWRHIGTDWAGSEE